MLWKAFPNKSCLVIDRPCAHPFFFSFPPTTTLIRGEDAGGGWKQVSDSEAGAVNNFLGKKNRMHRNLYMSCKTSKYLLVLYFLDLHRNEEELNLLQEIVTRKESCLSARWGSGSRKLLMRDTTDPANPQSTNIVTANMEQHQYTLPTSPESTCKSAAENPGSGKAASQPEHVCTKRWPKKSERERETTWHSEKPSRYELPRQIPSFFFFPLLPCWLRNSGGASE